MKHKRLKNYLKLGVLLFGILAIFQNCQKEDSFENEFKSQTDYYKTVSLNQLPKLKPVIENLKTFNKSNTNVSARQGTTYLGVENVLVDEIIQITNEDNISNYTFGIDTDFENTGFIENLYLREIEQGYISYIIRYEPNMDWYNNNLYSFHGKDYLNMENYQGNITKYSLEGEVIWSTKQEYIDNSTSSRSAGEFVTVCFISTAPVCGCNTPEHEHDPIGEGCDCVVYETTEVCQSGWVSGGGSINDDGNDGSDPTSGGGTGDNNNEDCETSGTLVVNEQPISGIGTGCSTNDETGTSVPTSRKRDCNKIENFVLATDTTYINKVRNLKNFDNLAYESAVTMSIDGTIAEYDGSGNNTKVNVPQNPNSDYTAISHVHNEYIDEDGILKPTYSVFSLSDLAEIATIYKKGKIRTSKFVAFLSTADDTHYALTISNITKFSEFFRYLDMRNTSLSEEEQKAGFDKFIEIADITDKYFLSDSNPLIKEEQNPAISLRLFMNFIKLTDMGITIFETVDNFQTFKELSTNEQGDVERAEPCEF